MVNVKREVQTKLTKGLLEMIILQFLGAKPMHGYQIIQKIRRSFGVYFGPSTIYPLLSALEKRGCVKSQWDMKTERPRKIYHLTNDGKDLLDYTEKSLNLIICKTIGTNNSTKEEKEVELSVYP